MISKKLTALVLISALFVSCSEDKQSPKPKFADNVRSLFGVLQVDSSQLLVTDSAGNAISGAQILIGSALGSPFAGNLISTSEDGVFTAPAEWTSAQSVTISAPGYVRATFMGQMPTGQKFALRKILPTQTMSLKGETTGFSVKDRDGLVDFGLVIPAITKQTFFNFDVSSFISKETDTITVVGRKIELPKNLSLPKQRESYYVGFELNKPQFQLDFNSAGERMIYVARGQFPINEVIGDIRNGKEFYELTNYFSIKGAAVRIMNVQNDVVQNLPVNELNYSGNLQVSGPTFSRDELVLSVPLAFWKGWYYPTDVKMLEAGKARNLTVAGGGTPYLLSVLKRKDEMGGTGGNIDRLSANFIPFTAGVAPSFLPLVDQPTVISPYHLQMKAVTKPAAINEGSQYSVLSKVSQVTIGGKAIDVLENVWEVYAPNWQTDMSIPEWPGENALSGRLRWEVTLTGVLDQNSLKNVDLGPKWLEAATHATRSSADF